MPYKNKEDINKASRRWQKKHKKKMNIVRNRHYKKLRETVLDAYGGKCKKCGFKDKRVLQIDHIDGGGSKERKIMSPRQLLFYLKRNNFPREKYQVLCANCNAMKRIEKKENRYKTE